MKLQPWMLVIRYMPGNENTMADALSRQEWSRDEETMENGISSGAGQALWSPFGAGRCEGPALMAEIEEKKIQREEESRRK